MPKLVFFAPQPVQLPEMLAARDRRRELQAELLAEYGRPLICFCMNMPGEIKYTPLSELAFLHGLERLHQVLGEPMRERVLRESTGAEAFLVYDRPAPELKRAAEAIEEESDLGRLFDMDVLDTDGSKLSRAVMRSCLVCGGPAAPCARSRAHGLEEVVAAAEKRLLAFAAEHYAALAEEALLREVRLTPKPGLVDADNCGAHRDMDLAMFEASAACLKSWFSELFLAGARQPDEMPVLQELGLRAEADMRKTTGGVNTHKGSIFTFGLILGALGASCRDGKDVFDRIAGLVRGMTPPERDTHGGMARQRYGAGGARAEAAAGLPTARGACQVLRKEGDLTALLWLMARCEDTNLLYRGGERGLRFVQRRSRWILRAPRTWRVGLARRLDEAMIRRNLSPGGCADLLAAAIFLDLCGLDGPRPEE